MNQLVLVLKVSVTPFVGVWIETDMQQVEKCSQPVTPFVGVWIETVSESAAYLD